MNQKSMSPPQRATGAPALEPVAHNGLLHRRALLGSGIAFAGALTTGAAMTGAAAEPLQEPAWSLEPGEVTPRCRSRRASKPRWCAT